MIEVSAIKVSDEIICMMQFYDDCSNGTYLI